MKKKVYDYIAQHPCSTENQCAEALQLNGLEVMKLIQTLRQEGYLKSTILPLDNGISSDNSNFYSVRKVYQETERIAR